jgi:hypothetical protein
VKIDARNYEQMKAWFAHMAPQTIAPELMTAEIHPIACLEQIESRWPGKARNGLAMAIGDTIDMTEGWPLARVAETDGLLASDGLPTLPEMRVRFSKVIRRVLTRGSIKNDVEYYALRNAVELTREGGEELWSLLSAYEAQQGR